MNTGTLKDSGRLNPQSLALGYGLIALFVIEAIIAMSAFLVQRPDPHATLITNSNAVFCRTPFQLGKAIIAADNGDGTRVRQLDCTRPGSGVRAKIIDPNMPLNGPWQVQLIYKDGSRPIMWGYAQDFQSNSNEP